MTLSVKNDVNVLLIMSNVLCSNVLLSLYLLTQLKTVYDLFLTFYIIPFFWLICRLCCNSDRDIPQYLCLIILAVGTIFPFIKMFLFLLGGRCTPAFC
jgi:hypothetical protein